MLTVGPLYGSHFPGHVEFCTSTIFASTNSLHSTTIHVVYFMFVYTYGKAKMRLQVASAAAPDYTSHRRRNATPTPGNRKLLQRQQTLSVF
jgi:hypothetical protein